MKNIIKLIGLFILIVFSFFYTDKVIEVIREEDNIMISIQEVKDLYKIDSINATISSNTIIPGINGRVVNVDKSYKEMKSIGVFNKNNLIYDVIKPNISIENNKDKFIIKGNTIKQMISIIFVLDNTKYLDKINSIAKKKDIIINYFIDYNFLIDNSTIVKEMTNSEFYSYGTSGVYSSDSLLFSNNLISRISNNEAIYCLSLDKDNSVIEICSKNNLYTIAPSIIGGNTPYNNVKNFFYVSRSMTKNNNPFG